MKQLKYNLLSLLTLAIIWQMAHIFSSGVGIPSIYDTIMSLFSNFPLLVTHLSVSILRIIIANSAAMVIGSFLGYFMASSKRFNDMLSPSVYALIPVPKVAFLPLFMILFGIGEKARIILLSFILVFQYIVAAKDAVLSLSSLQTNVVKSLNLSFKIKLKYILLPHYYPYLFTVIRQSFGMSLAVLFYIETFINQTGIGYFIMNRWSSINYPEMFAGIVSVSLCGIWGYKLIDAAAKKVSPWK